MRFAIYSIVVLLFFSCDKKKQADCKRFKQGEFYQQVKDGVQLVIERGEAHQTIYDPRTDTITGHQLQWLSDCEYECTTTYRLKKTMKDTSDMRAVMDMNRIQTIRYTIIETFEDKYYIFEARPENSNSIYTDTMWVKGLIGGFKPIGEVFKTK